MDKVTLEMARLLAQRSRLVEQIGLAKQSLGMGVDDEERESQLRQKVAASCQNPKDAQTALRLLNFLLNESVKAQSERAAPSMSHMSVFAEAKRLEAQGKPMIHMEVGEPKDTPPESACTALASACAKGLTRYGSAYGTDELREAIMRRESPNKSDISKDNVIVTMGARFAVYLAIESLLEAGDEIIVIEPAWPAYAQCAMRAGVKVRRIHTTLESKWEPDIAQIESAITPNTKMIALNYPNNPTGKILPDKLYQEIMGIAQRHSLYVLSDEIYSDYSTKFKSALAFEYDRTIITQSLSKSHAMTGFRIGYAVASKPIISKLGQLQSLCVVCPPSPIQHAALGALEGNLPDTAKTTLERLDVLAGLAKNLEFSKPDGAMYLFAKLPRNLDGSDVASECLKQGLAIAPGAGFGAYSDYVRLSACQDAQTLGRGMDIINNVISQS